MRRLGNFLGKVLQETSDDSLFMMAAAVAFYTCLSLAPLVVLLVWLGGFIGPEAQDALTDEFRDVVGFQGAEAVREIVERAREERPQFGTPMGFLGLLVLVYGSTHVFIQLQVAMNMIWDVEPISGGKRIVWDWLKKRVASMAMVGVVAFMLLVSLVLDAVIQFFAAEAAEILPNLAFARIANVVVSFLVFVLVFAGVFKFVPDVKVEWRDVWFGASITSGLFIVGRALLSYYLATYSFTSTYGAAGAFVVLLLWVYYSSFTLFLGAEVTQVWSRRHGRGLETQIPAEIDQEEAHKVVED